MSNTSESQNGMSTCATCGKGEEASIDLKSCAACMLVKYCSRDCQAAHRPQHKRDCKRRAAELHDEKLFKQPPPLEDCPICMIRLPSVDTGRTYMPCCGKIICTGCVHAFQSRAVKEEDQICPFCRTLMCDSDDETIKRFEKRSDLNDPIAIRHLGRSYSKGNFGVPQNRAKALELYHRAGELGDAQAWYNLSCAYRTGSGVEVDEKRAKHYAELAAIKGYVDARHNLGVMEILAGNVDRALKHWMIAAKDGDTQSVKNIKNMYMDGDVTKDDYAKALLSYQGYLDEIRSDQRDEAAAFVDEYQYY